MSAFFFFLWQIRDLGESIPEKCLILKSFNPLKTTRRCGTLVVQSGKTGKRNALDVSTSKPGSNHSGSHVARLLVMHGSQEGTRVARWLLQFTQTVIRVVPKTYKHALLFLFM